MNTCGACLRTCASIGDYFRGIAFEICIRTFPPPSVWILWLCSHTFVPGGKHQGNCISTLLLPISRHKDGILKGKKGGVHLKHILKPRSRNWIGIAHRCTTLPQKVIFGVGREGDLASQGSIDLRLQHLQNRYRALMSETRGSVCRQSQRLK